MREFAFCFILGSEFCEPARRRQGTSDTQEEQVKTFLDAGEKIIFFVVSSIGKNNSKHLSVVYMGISYNCVLETQKVKLIGNKTETGLK